MALLLVTHLFLASHRLILTFISLTYFLLSITLFIFFQLYLFLLFLILLALNLFSHNPQLPIFLSLLFMPYHLQQRLCVHAFCLCFFCICW